MAQVYALGEGLHRSVQLKVRTTVWACPCTNNVGLPTAAILCRNNEGLHCATPTQHKQ